MTGRMLGGVTLLVAALLSGSHGSAVSALAPGPSLPAAGVPAPGVAAPGVAEQRHHYVLSVRVRPLVVFWIGRSNIGDAILTRAALPQEARYSLLIGSDPDRAPRRINRWGYIEERIRVDGAAAVVGLMTESEEETVEEAEASLRKDRGGVHTFKVIQAAIDAKQSRSVVTSVGAPADYSFRQVRSVLALARDGGTAGVSRVVQLPQGTRPGFLSALAEIIHTQAKSSGGGTIQAGAPLKYVYHGRFYDLRATSIQFKRRFDVNTSRNAGIVSAQFTAKSLNDGEEDRFALSYAIDGPLAEVPLTISYQPRWWMQIDLVLADDVSSPLMAALDR